MRRYLLITVLVLAGCGSVPQQQPLPVVVDVARTLFRTSGRNIGPATITDVIADNGLITRNADTPTNDFETHSIYQIDEAAGCIRAVAEETWNKYPKYLHYIQEYPEKPCWAPLNTINVVATPKFSSRYTWKQFNPDGTQIGETFTEGTWEDYTIFTPGATLLEYYKDTTASKQPTEAYCVQGSYDFQGLASLGKGTCKP
jgi:hypothetical protein